jgi:hypothetical protein
MEPNPVAQRYAKFLKSAWKQCIEKSNRIRQLEDEVVVLQKKVKRQSKKLQEMRDQLSAN